MALSLLEMVRKLIRQDTRTVGGPVGSWHGTVARDLSALVVGGNQSWLLLELPGTVLPELNEFYQAFLGTTSRGSLLQAAEGVVSFTAPAGTVQLLRGVIDTPKSVSATLQLEVGGSEGKYAVYLDDTLVRRGQGSGTIPLRLPPGRYVVAVLVQAPSTVVRTPGALPLNGMAESPPRPVWQGVRTGYLNAQSGNAVNTLTWFAAPTAGGYRVLRRTPTEIGTLIADDGVVIAIGSVAVDDQFVVTIQGDHVGVLSPGATLLSGSLTVGSVVRVQLDNDNNTEVRCRLPLGLSEPDQAWVGGQAAVGSFTELARIARTDSGPVMSYQDAVVTAGLAYEYALQAFGLLDEAVLSALSDVQFVVAGDTAAPGPIAFEAGFPQVFNKIAVIRFMTPNDSDYQGVNVYFRQSVQNGAPGAEVPYQVFSVAGAVVQIDDPELGVNELVGFNVQIGADPLVYTVLSNTAGAITLDQAPQLYGNASDPFAAPVGPVAGDPLLIYKDIRVTTDFGLPGRADELSFFAEKFGAYYFASFDRSRNEQAIDDADAGAAVRWDYTTADDVVDPNTTVGPVVAFRQLVGAEQALFAAPYNNPRNYALVEVFASSPLAGPGAIFDGVVLNYQRKGDSTPQVLAPVPQQAQSFPFIVTSGLDAVVDNPSGVRSRFIALSRQTDNMWIRVWAIDSNALESDTLTFLVDFDTTPAITSLETSVDPSNDLVTFTTVVDDDALGLVWYVDPPTPDAVPPEPTELAPQHVDTRSLKRILRAVKLSLGQQRTLVLVPYAGWNATTGQVEGSVGEAVTRKVVRTPRSYVTFDNKDENGNRSENSVRATFAVVPSPELVSVGNPTALNTVDGNTELTDGLAAWTPNVFASAPLTHYYAKLLPRLKNPADILDKPPLPVIRKISTNTATVLTLTGVVDRLSEYTEGYEIYDGAVEVRTRTKLGVENTVTPFLPTAGQEFRGRLFEFSFEFFGTKNGAVQENTRLALVDTDSEARLLNFGLTHDSATATMTASVGGADDDAKHWRVYLRKGNWPTLTEGSQDGAIDDKYLRFSGPVVQTNFTFNASEGTWFGIAVPENSFGRDGARAFASLATGGAPPQGMASLTTAIRTTTDQVELRYPLLSGTVGTVSVTASRSDAPSTVFTLVSGRNAHQDANDVVPGEQDVGGFRHAVGEDVLSAGFVSGAVQRTWNYTVTFTPFGGGPTSFKTASASYWASTATPPPPGGPTLSAFVQITDTGSCSLNLGTTKPAQCGSPHTRRIRWNSTALDPAFLTPSYRLAIDVSEGFPFDWMPLVSVPVTNGSWDHKSSCIYRPAGGAGVSTFPAGWGYQVRLVFVTSGETVQTFSAQSNPALQTDAMTAYEANVAFCSADN